MSTEEAARGAVGLPRGGPEESEGGPAAASAAAAEPLALADGWEDWPEEVWAEFRRGAEPLTWNRAQRIAGRVCREGSLRYGRESSERFKKFELAMSEAFGPGWRIRAQREEVFAKRRLELRKAETEAALEEEFGVAADPPGGRLDMEPAAGAPAGFAELSGGAAPRSRMGDDRSDGSFGTSTREGLAALRRSAGVQFDDAFSETSTRFDARIAAEAEFLLNRSHPEPKIEGHVLEQTWVRKKILEYQRLDPPSELDLGTWASIQVYTQCRSLGESDQEVFARSRALGILAKEGGVEVDVARAIGRLQLGGRPPGAGSDNRTSTGVMGTPERSASRVAASSPGDAGTTPRIRLPDSPGGEGEAAARDSCCI